MAANHGSGSYRRGGLSPARDHTCVFSLVKQQQKRQEQAIELKSKIPMKARRSGGNRLKIGHPGDMV